MTPHTTSPDANTELIRATQEEFNAGDFDACVARLAPDFVINLAELPEPMYGRDTWRQNVEVMKRAFPDIQAHIQDVVAAQDRAPAWSSVAPTPLSSWVFPPPAGASNTSVTSSTASPTA